MRARALYFLFLLFGFIGMVLDLLAKGSRWLGDQATYFSEWCGSRAADINPNLFPTRKDKS